MNTLIESLNERGPKPALIYYGADGRTELSGRVLANWLIKNINLLRDVVDLNHGDHLLIDLPPHWKRTVMAVSGALIGAHTVLIDDQHADAPALNEDYILATAHPTSQLAENAREVLAIEPVSLALKFPGELDPFCTDWLEAVRSQSDVLTNRLTTALAENLSNTDSAKDKIAVEHLDTADLARAIQAWLRGACVLTPVSAMTKSDLSAEGIE